MTAWLRTIQQLQGGQHWLTSSSLEISFMLTSTCWRPRLMNLMASCCPVVRSVASTTKPDVPLQQQDE